MLGVIIPDITNPFFANIVRGIEKEIKNRNYSVVLCDTNGDIDTEKEAVSLLRRQKVAGIISASVASGKDAERIYSDPDVNVVFIDNMPDLKKDFSSVTINNFVAAKELTRILLDKGHRDICMISGPKNESSAVERLDGFIAAHKELGITVNERYIKVGNYRLESGALIMQDFLDTGFKPTAVFAANNFMAYGATHTLISAGLRVPEDVIIATFDVVDYTGLVRNKFISIIQPAFEIGCVSADICINESQKDRINSCKIILKHQIET